MTATAPAAQARWTGAGWDLLAFGGGLAFASWQGWRTTDLVWSLWLSSLTVGYALIVWSIVAPSLGARTGPPTDPERGRRVVGLVLGLCLLVPFFTLHFGGFHAVHAVFLHNFFPVAGPDGEKLKAGALFLEIVQRYGWFVPAALLAERHAFVRAGRAGGKFGGGPLLLPYLNVVRMHVLIFFFAFAHTSGFANPLTYIAVYAVYFFPWRRVLPARGPVAGAESG